MITNPKKKAPPCNHCGHPDLYWGFWYNQHAGKNVSRMYYDDGTLHDCLNIPSHRYVASGGEPGGPPEDQAMPAPDLEKIISYIAQTLEVYDQKIKEKVQEAQVALADKVVAAQLANEATLRADLTTLCADSAHKIAESVARTVVAELVPVQHEIVVKDYAGVIQQKIATRPHHKLDYLVRKLSIRRHCMLSGPAGSSKTTCAQMAAEILGLSYYERAMTGTLEDDIVGRLSPDGRFIPGFLYKPYKDGGLVCEDEGDSGEASALVCQNPAFANGHFTFPNGERVKRHPDFVAVLTANTWGRGGDQVYAGRNRLDGAFLDRFAKIAWDYDESAEFDWAGRDQVDWVKFVQRARKVAFDHKLHVVISPRASIMGAEDLRLGIDDVEGCKEAYIWLNMSKDDRAKIEANM